MTETTTETPPNPNSSLLELSSFFSVDILGQPKLLIPSVNEEEYVESICPDTYNKEFTSSSAQVLIGQSINNNGGLQLSQVIGGKTPNYEDFLDKPHTVVHHKKTMLDGLLLSTGLDAPTTTFKTLNDLSSKLLQLPAKKKGDIHIGLRSINGLPYFEENESLYRISQLKKDPLKLKDIENTHGAVILNQLLNNKRKLRNFQWKQYYNDRSGNSLTNNLQVSLKSNIRENTVLLDEEALIEEAKLEAEEILRKRKAQADAAANQAIATDPNMPGPPVPMPIPTSEETETAEEKASKLKAELEAKQQRVTKRLQDQELRKNIKKHKRFIYDPKEYIMDALKDTVVIEEEVVTQNLSYVAGMQNSQPPQVRKLVRKRKIPNANSLGHSNIRGVKPTYWN